MKNNVQHSMINKFNSKTAKYKRQKFFSFTMIFMALFMFFAVTASAAGVDEVLGPIYKMQTLMLLLFQAIGVLVVLYAFSKIAPAIHAHDGGNILTGCLIMATGLILIFLRPILVFLDVPLQG